MLRAGQCPSTIAGKSVTLLTSDNQAISLKTPSLTTHDLSAGGGLKERNLLCSRSGKKSDPRFVVLRTSRSPADSAGTIYAPADSLWLLDWAMPYWRIL
jgi:hypothetical protein